MPRIKRKPGAQPGNHNARKHGFYSRNISPEQLANLPPATKTPGLDSEIALLRLKISSIVHDDPHNLDPLLRTVASLRLAVATRHKLVSRRRRSSRAFLNQVISDAVEMFVSQAPEDLSGGAGEVVSNGSSGNPLCLERPIPNLVIPPCED
jgi:hypothetical protein